MMQLPPRMAVTDAPLMVQMVGVVLVNVTALLDAPPVALALAVPPTAMLGAAPNTIA